jgi:translation initiation factor IF-3
VLVVLDDGERLGIMPVREAVEVALERGVDLVEVAPNAQPPVCRLLDYGRFRYEQSKKERELKKGTKTAELGEVRLRPKIGQHDVDFKTRQVRKLITGGDKVKVSVIFRGRENTHPELAVALLRRVAEAVQDICAVDVPPQLEGRGMSMILAPGKAKRKAAEIVVPTASEDPTMDAGPSGSEDVVAAAEEIVASAPDTRQEQVAGSTEETPTTESVTEETEENADQDEEVQAQDA